MEYLFEAPPDERRPVLLGSGPGPSPAAADLGQVVASATLQQVDQETGLRGWMLHVRQGNRPELWPRHHFSRGVRPPLIEAREEALRALGYEPVPGHRWRWQESTTLDHRQVLMFAGIPVRPVAEDGAGEATA